MRYFGIVVVPSSVRAARRRPPPPRRAATRRFDSWRQVSSRRCGAVPANAAVAECVSARGRPTSAEPPVDVRLVRLDEPRQRSSASASTAAATARDSGANACQRIVVRPAIDLGAPHAGHQPVDQERRQDVAVRSDHRLAVRRRDHPGAVLVREQHAVPHRQEPDRRQRRLAAGAVRPGRRTALGRPGALEDRGARPAAGPATPGPASARAG